MKAEQLKTTIKDVIEVRRDAAASLSGLAAWLADYSPLPVWLQPVESLGFRFMRKKGERVPSVTPVEDTEIIELNIETVVCSLPVSEVEREPVQVVKKMVKALAMRMDEHIFDPRLPHVEHHGQVDIDTMLHAVEQMLLQGGKFFCHPSLEGPLRMMLKDMVLQEQQSIYDWAQGMLSNMNPNHPLADPTAGVLVRLVELNSRARLGFVGDVRLSTIWGVPVVYHKGVNPHSLLALPQTFTWYFGEPLIMTAHEKLMRGDIAHLRLDARWHLEPRADSKIVYIEMG